ncbi:flavodoxin domain-containing protein [Pacificibacter sp. AS14]|uniref:flavodoxin domain-containing protein n=1 Tax=Pacificibacter sp. AS14 TaxID=3135785 RepID=UPI00316EB1C6
MNISFLFGTETGNAEMLADDLNMAFEEQHDTRVANLQDTTVQDLQTADLNIIVCSSYGDGDLPGSAQAFASVLQKERPDLSGVRFAMFGLGDMEYASTFGHGSMKLATLLVECGAQSIGARVVHDASNDEMVEDMAIPWAENVVGSL